MRRLLRAPVFDDEPPQATPAPDPQAVQAALEAVLGPDLVAMLLAAPGAVPPRPRLPALGRHTSDCGV